MADSVKYRYSCNICQVGIDWLVRLGKLDGKVGWVGWMRGLDW